MCDGPLIWFSSGDDDEGGAVLECARPDCDYVVATGGFNDAYHDDTPILREGMPL